ncbi:MAG: thioesterase family protein [Bacteroidota bacterium]
MDFSFPQGLEGFKEIIVQAQDTAANYGSGLIEVYATPAMVGLMESTAQQSLIAYLPEGYITLGIEINVKHVKATPVGDTVCCYSKLIEVEGKKLQFEIEAKDSKGTIGTAKHWRYIVNAKDFIEKLNNA